VLRTVHGALRLLRRYAGHAHARLGRTPSRGGQRACRRLQFVTRAATSPHRAWLRDALDMLARDINRADQ